MNISLEESAILYIPSENIVNFYTEIASNVANEVNVVRIIFRQ